MADQYGNGVDQRKMQSGAEEEERRIRQMTQDKTRPSKTTPMYIKRTKRDSRKLDR